MILSITSRVHSIENACGGITGRSPSFGDHLSGRQTRKHVRRSRSRVPAALFLGVLGSTWGLLGSFLGVLGQSSGPLGSIFRRLGAFLGALGTSWDALGGILGDLGALVERLVNQVDVRSVLRSILDAKRAPKWSSDRTWARKGRQKGGFGGAKMEPK